MSTYIYLVCDGHEEPVQAEDESGEHLYDLPQLRLDWANRKHWLDYIARFPDALTREFDHLAYFQRHTFWFIRDHAACGPLRVVSEYGEEYPLDVETVAEMLSTDRASSPGAPS